MSRLPCRSDSIDSHEILNQTERLDLTEKDDFLGADLANKHCRKFTEMNYRPGSRQVDSGKQS